MLNGELVYAYNHRTVNASRGDYVGTNNLSWARLAPASHVAVADVDVDTYTVAPNADVGVHYDLVNLGTNQADSLHVSITDSEGQTYYDTDVAQALPAGSTLRQTTTVKMPATLTKRSLIVKVSDPANTKKYNDQEKRVSIGVDEIYLEAERYRVGDLHGVSVSAVNEGFGAAQGTIEIYDCDTGFVYDSHAFSGLENGTVLHYSATLDMIDWTHQQDLLIGVRLKNGEAVPGRHDCKLQITSEGIVDVRAVTIQSATVELTTLSPSALLVATAQPSNATVDGFRWWSVDEGIATVDQMGNVTAVANGTTRIYAQETSSGKLVSCSVTVSLSAPTPTIVRGDVTGDGQVAMNDILKVNSYLLGRIQLTDAELAAADVTGDGQVAMNDILKINSFLLGRIETL